MKRFIFIIAVVLFSACSTLEKVVYFQNAEVVPMTQNEGSWDGIIRVQPFDQIAILVSSRNPELATIFNLIEANSVVGQANQTSQSSGSLLSYGVDSLGFIDFPVLGRLNILNKSRLEVETLVQERIISSGMLKDPIVTAQFMNLKYSVMGDVSKPGLYTIENDKITVLEALSQSGDLNITAVRDGVYVMREVDGKVKSYQIDLRSIDIYKSQGFYIQQNDVIYVEPNGTKANQSTVNGNTFRSATFWMSLTSFVLTIALLFL